MRHRLAAIAAMLLGCDHGAAPSHSIANRGATDGPAAIAAPAGPRYCFSWVHLDDFSTDCYQTTADCEQARLAMEAGSRDVTPECVRSGASCTTLERGAGHDEERCFGDTANCERYRSYVSGNGYSTTPCTEP